MKLSVCRGKRQLAPQGPFCFFGFFSFFFFVFVFFCFGGFVGGWCAAQPGSEAGEERGEVEWRL